MFNGKSTVKYLATDYPMLKNNDVTQVICDKNNRIWLLTGGGNVTMIDEKRQLYHVALYDKKEFIKTLKILNSKKYGVSLNTSKGNYIFNSESSSYPGDSIPFNHFKLLPLTGSASYKFNSNSQVFYYDDNGYLLIGETAFAKVNYISNSVERIFSFSNCKPLIKWGMNELLVYDRSARETKIIDLTSEEVSYPFRNLKDQFEKTINTDFVVAEKISEFQYLFGTENSGIYIYDIISGKIYNYVHYTADPTSVASNFIRSVAVGKGGWIFLSSLPNGISYFNNTEVVSNQYVFTDRSGQSYDGLIQGIVTKDNNTFYLGTQTGMLEWKRNSNTTRFIDFKDMNDRSVFNGQQVYSILIDEYDRVWASAVDNGVIIMDKKLQLLKHIKKDSTDNRSLKLTRVNYMLMGPDGYVWLCGRNGISRINPGNFQIDNLETTALKKFDSMRLIPLLFTDKDNLWIAASNEGLYHYKFSTNYLEEVEAFKPYKKEGIIDIKADSSGNIYVANRSSTGLKILFKNGSVKTISQKDGLLMDWTEGLILDKHNHMWVGNDIALGCYNPADSSLKAFDVRYGLSIYGFRAGSYYQAPNGEFILGTPRGLQYFHPDSLYNKKISLSATIEKIETKNIIANITGSSSFHLKSKDNQVIFYLSSVEFSRHLTTYYAYKLVGLDKDWIKIADQNIVRYNSLPPGKYIFKVRISNDNKNWQEAENEVTINIAAPFYQVWWFKMMALFVGLSLIWIVLKHYQRKQARQRESLENKQKVIEARLQSLRLQMNPHFLFNALNSIQQMILASEEMVATRYLSKFSKLLRTILVHSDKEYVSLKEELEILDLYVELESIRFKDSFKYKIEVDEEIDTDEIKLPTLLVQPFVENAIWHGLMHKEGERLLTVKFSENNDCIECIVEDNGIGRERSGGAKLTTGRGDKHTNKGIAVSIERLNAMGNGRHGSLEIIDLKDEKGNAKGTRVQIIFPLQNN